MRLGSRGWLARLALFLLPSLHLECGMGTVARADYTNLR